VLLVASANIFHKSIREDGLLSIADDGVIFALGFGFSTPWPCTNRNIPLTESIRELFAKRAGSVDVPKNIRWH
jgi:hypothetical protein